MTEPTASIFTISELERRLKQDGRRYLEFLRLPALSTGIYVLPARATDTQKPHHEDEIYYVIRGRARFQVAEEDREVNAGSVIFVGAGVEHRFHDIAEDLTVLVFFAPAETPAET